ncbi:hypothetical protein D3C87_1888470 [compost metagenome]
MQPVKSGGNEHIPGGGTIFRPFHQIARKLQVNKVAVTHILVEGADHPVAVG